MMCRELSADWVREGLLVADDDQGVDGEGGGEKAADGYDDKFGHSKYIYVYESPSISCRAEEVVFKNLKSMTKDSKTIPTSLFMIKQFIRIN